MVNFVAQLAHVVLPSTFVLYATYRYGWDTTTVGLTLAMVGICAMVVQGAAIGPIVRRFGERRALLLGLGCGAIGFLIFGAAPTGPLFWLGIPVMALWGVAGAATQALMTQLVAPDQQGQLQGATTSVQSVSQTGGTVSVHADIRLFHRRAGAAEIAGRAVPAGLGAVGAGAGDRGAHAVAPRRPADALSRRRLKLMQRAGLVVVEFAGLGPGRRAHRHDEFRGLIRRVERQRIFAGKHAWRACACGSGRD